MLRRLRAHRSRKLLQIFSSQLGQLWICLAVISILYVTLQITGILQQSRCDRELKTLRLQHISGIQNSIRFQRDPPLESLHDSILQNRHKKLLIDPTYSGNIMEVREFSKEFIISNGLSNLENLKEPEMNGFPEETSEVWLPHSDSDLEKDFQDLLMKSGTNIASVTSAPFVTGISSSAQANADTFNSVSAIANRINTDKLIKTAPLEKYGNSSEGDFEAIVYFSLNRRNKTSRTTTIANTVLIQRSIKPGVIKVVKKDNSKPINVPVQKYGMLLQGKLAPPKPGANQFEFTHVQGQSLLSISPISYNCKPQTHIVFLKVHKSASSTIMNILFRFGDNWNLTFAFPYNNATQLFYPQYFMTSFVEGFSASKMMQFNIMCHHMRFLKTEVQKVMPNDTFYFSILRNPVHLMESSFAYYKSASPFFRAKTLEEFLDQPLKFYNASDFDSHYAKNLMTFDFGFNHNGKSSAKHARQNFELIKSMFDLVLIAEHFDESMVLLKEALCWSLDDVVSFSLNSRDEKTKVPLSKNSTEKIKNWNKLDWQLYIHFNRTFWDRIDQTIGREQMQKKVKELRMKREELTRICLQGESMVDPLQIKDLSLAPLQYGQARILGYNLKPGLDKLTRDLCQRLVTPELQYSSLLYKRQFPKKARELQSHITAKFPLQYFKSRNKPWKRGK